MFSFVLIVIYLSSREMYIHILTNGFSSSIRSQDSIIQSQYHFVKISRNVFMFISRFIFVSYFLVSKFFISKKRTIFLNAKLMLNHDASMGKYSNKLVQDRLMLSVGMVFFSQSHCFEKYNPTSWMDFVSTILFDKISQIQY